MQNAVLPAGDVPLELTSFIGRERELEALRRLAGSARLITLTGAGGSGKSRLARQLAPDLAAATAAGVAWVELAPITDPALVPGAVLRVLDPSAEKGGNARDLVVDLLRTAPPLLVLDNCEHLVDACAELVDVLLRSCPDLRILATSREALSVPGERAWLVPPLAVPAAELTLETAAEYDAIRLFVERARDVLPDFSLTPSNARAVSEICARLDGIPLAIELAAARVRVMAPEQIRDRLSDAFALLSSGSRTALPRHRTLKAAIDWSYALLPPDARTVLQRLSVFRGGFTLDAAEAVASGGDIAPGEVLDLVAALLDRSLLVMREHDGTARYMLLETMRQYAARLLAETEGGDDVRRAMAAYYFDMVAAEEPAFTTTSRKQVFVHLDAELDNLREVLEWTHGHDTMQHVRLVGMLWWFWFGSRLWLEARRWITDALALPEGQRDGQERAALLFAGGALSSLQAQVPAARAQLTEAIRLAADAGDSKLEAYACNYLGMTYAQVGDPESRVHCARAESWLRPAGDMYGLRLSLLLQGMGEAAAGDLRAARRLMEEAVSIARTFGQDRELGIALQTFAGVVHADGDAATAAALLTESLAALQRDWSYLFAARAVDFLGVICAASDPIEAARRLGAGDALRERVGAARFQVDQQRVDAATGMLREVLGDAGFDSHYAEGRAARYRIVEEIVARAAVQAPGGTPAAAGQAAGGAGAAADDTASASAATPDDAAGMAAAKGRSAEPRVTRAAVTVAADPEPAGQPAADLHVTLFGGLEVHVQGTKVESWSYAKPKELLAFLLAHPRGRTRAEIGAAIWPDASPAQLRNSFHVTMHHLRKSIGRPDWIVVDSERYRVAPGVSLETDVGTFEREVRALLAVAISDATPDDAARLRTALDLYRDHYLAGEVAGRWRDEEQDRLRALYTDAGLHLGTMLEAAGDSAAAVTVYEELLTREPLLEEAHRRLIGYWSASGDRVRAVRHYERLAARLQEELGLEPDPETTELYEGLKA